MAEIVPLHIIIVVWGDVYCGHLIKWCLPSLSSIGNRTALIGAELVICCPDKDRKRLTDHPALLPFPNVVFLEIPECPSNKNGCQHMGVGHKLASNRAYQAKARAMFLAPDSIISDGTLTNAVKRADEGYDAVMCAAAMRVEETAFLDYLSGCQTPWSGRSIVISMMHAPHPETMTFNWDNPCFAYFPALVWWKMKDGFIVHSFAHAHLIIDYGAFTHHDTSTFETWTLDGDYLFKNLGREAKIYVCQDSDEMMVASWSPLYDRHQYPPRRDILKGAAIRMAYRSDLFDPIRRNLFMKPAFWHVDALTQEWDAREREIQRALKFYLHGPRWIFYLATMLFVFIPASGRHFSWKRIKKHLRAQHSLAWWGWAICNIDRAMLNQPTRWAQPER